MKKRDSQDQGQLDLLQTEKKTTAPLPNSRRPPPPKYPRKVYQAKYPNDPYLEQVKEVQAHANLVFRTRHRLFVGEDETSGATPRHTARYTVIRRCLTDWGFTVQELKWALDKAALDPWFRSRQIWDTCMILSRLDWVQRFVDLSQEREHAMPVDGWKDVNAHGAKF
jgi:hypothetical protein